MLRLTSCGFNLIKSVGDREWGVGKTNKDKGKRTKEKSCRFGTKRKDDDLVKSRLTGENRCPVFS